MSTKIEQYRSLQYPIPSQTWAWNMYGPGVENIGKEGAPEEFTVPEPGADQLLVRVDAVGMCFSDVKLIKQGGNHPKLYNRNLATDPTRVGHEATVTVVKVGQALQGSYRPGQRLIIQPDIYRDGKSTAYGYTIPGGLIQYHLMGAEVLDADGKNYALPLEGEMGYAEAALTEPWACVDAAYTQRRRLQPKVGGVMWIVGQPDDATPYEFSTGLDAPGTIILSNVPDSVRRLVEQEAADRELTVIKAETPAPDEVADFAARYTAGAGFDDTIILNPRSAAMVAEVAKQIARRGMLNLVGQTPPDGLVLVDVGRIHYDYTAYVGNPGPDIAASYGEARNRCDLRPGGVTLFVGAGGPMGQMHVQRAIELADGPALIIATDINSDRLAAIQTGLLPLAEARNKKLLTFNPAEADETLPQFVRRHTANRGADDVVVSVPIAGVMAEAASVMTDDGMLVLFAGVPNDTFAPLDLGKVYLHNTQYTGTSGSTLDDQANIISKTQRNELSPNRSVAAVGGIEAATEGIDAMMTGRYPGKVVIYPQLSGLPLTAVSDLKETQPAVAEHLAPGDVWTTEAEDALIERFWKL